MVYLSCPVLTLTCQILLHGYWQKTGDSWVRSDGLAAYSQHIQQHKFYVCVISLSPLSLMNMIWRGSGRWCTFSSGFWAKLGSLELREPIYIFFIENRKPVWLFVPDLYCSGQITGLPFFQIDTISIFRGCLLCKHTWQDSTKQRQSVALLVGRGKIQMTHGELSPKRSTKNTKNKMKNIWIRRWCKKSA